MSNRFDILYAKLKSKLLLEDSLDAGICAETELFKSRVKQMAKQLADELDYSISPDEFYTELDQLAGMGAVDDFQVLSKMNDARLNQRLRSIMQQMKENDENRLADNGAQADEGPFVISTLDGWFRNGDYNERGEFLGTTVNDISEAHKFATREEAEEIAEKMKVVYTRFEPPNIEVHALADEKETYKPSLFGW